MQSVPLLFGKDFNPAAREFAPVYTHFPHLSLSSTFISLLPPLSPHPLMAAASLRARHAPSPSRPFPAGHHRRRPRLLLHARSTELVVAALLLLCVAASSCSALTFPRLGLAEHRRCAWRCRSCPWRPDPVGGGPLRRGGGPSAATTTPIVGRAPSPRAARKAAGFDGGSGHLVRLVLPRCIWLSAAGRRHRRSILPCAFLGSHGGDLMAAGSGAAAGAWR